MPNAIDPTDAETNIARFNQSAIASAPALTVVYAPWDLELPRPLASRPSPTLAARPSATFLRLSQKPTAVAPHSC
jgi:hypothetical protein